MFWDSSALVPLVFPEAQSADLVALAERSPGFVIWWGTPLECQSAGYRRYREKRATFADLRSGLQQLREVVADSLVVLPSDVLRARAERLIASHPLRAADALQLAAGLVACEDQPWNESFVCLDSRLRAAAAQEGFTVVPDSGT
jgi:uncharacterized protein